MSKHTPGLWRVNRSGVSIDAGRTRIRQEAGGPWDEERKANALLIAAAPDLLDTCRRCAEALEHGKEGGPFMIMMLRQSIAKAEGRTCP